jgi:hypothetical protein
MEMGMSAPDGEPVEEERRGKKRFRGALPVRVRGTDVDARQFQAQTLLDDLSASGLYMQLPFRVTRGIRLLMTIRYVMPVAGEDSAHTIVASGIVRRTEDRPGGLYGIGVEFTSWKLKYGDRLRIPRIRKSGNT